MKTNDFPRVGDFTPECTSPLTTNSERPAGWSASYEAASPPLHCRRTAFYIHLRCFKKAFPLFCFPVGGFKLTGEGVECVTDRRVLQRAE